MHLHWVKHIIQYKQTYLYIESSQNDFRLIQQGTILQSLMGWSKKHIEFVRVCNSSRWFTILKAFKLFLDMCAMPLVVGIQSFHGLLD